MLLFVAVWMSIKLSFTARCYANASAVCAVILSLSAYDLSVCLSFFVKIGIVPKGLNLGSGKRRKYDRPRKSSFLLPKIYMRNSNLLTPNLDTNIGGGGFSTNISLSILQYRSVTGGGWSGGGCCHAGRDWKCTTWKWRTENSQRIAGSGKRSTGKLRTNF